MQEGIVMNSNTIQLNSVQKYVINPIEKLNVFITHPGFFKLL